ncbi:MAG TPA: hypothetical protein ENI07_09500 [Desulfobacterales bacterium]|nr:hypothetical protein [Desulfobacterales bacterium]
MRISCHKDDPGYSPLATRRCVPFLNGWPVSYCYTADEEGGYVWRYKTNSIGKTFLNAEGTGCEREQLFGVVEIKLINSNR